MIMIARLWHGQAATAAMPVAYFRHATAPVFLH